MKKTILFLTIMLFTASMAFGVVVEIGTGTGYSPYYWPFYNYYENNKTQTLYLSSELGSAQSFTNISFDIERVAAAGYENLVDFTVNFLHTSATALIPGAYHDMTGATQVFYNASYTLATATGWNDINITDFAYNGTDNLIVEIIWGDQGAYTSTYYRNLKTDDGADVVRTLYGYADSETPPLYDGSSTYYSNIQFHYLQAGAPGEPTNPTPADLATDIAITTDLSWTNGTLTDDVQVLFGTDATPVSEVYNGVAVETLLNATIGGPLNPGTTYYWQVIASNSTADLTTPGPIWSFTTYAPPLTGTKTIGTGGDYTTFNDAVDYLNVGGVGTGGVIFNVLAGTYTEQISIGVIPGASASNPIVFQSAPVDDPAFLQFAATGTGDNWVVLLDGADYVTFQNMTFTSTGVAAYGRIFVLQNEATNNNILNNTIVGNSYASTSANVVCIYSPTSSVDENNTIQDNSISYGSYGIHFDGLSTTYEDNNQILGNTVTDFYYYGIRMEYQTNTLVNENTVIGNSGVYSTAYGIYMYYCDEAMQVLENIVSLSASSSNYLMYIYYCDGTVGQPQLIANNMLSQTVGTSTAYGIYAYYDTYVNIYNNSININAGSTTTGRALYFYCSTTVGSNIDVLNNVVVNIGGGLAVEITANAVTAGYVTGMDYNDLYATGSVLGDYGGTDCADFATWQTTSGFDTNSLSVDPIFTSPTDLHANAPALNSSCPRLAEVLVDIDGDSRPDPTDMGADEFIPAACSPPSALTVGSITTTSASLGWTENGSAMVWNIELGTAGFSPTGTPTQSGVTNPYIYTGLTAQTSYDWYVQADCGPGGTSTWTGPSTFATLCDAITTYPWSENFDASTNTPDCWTNNSTEAWEFSISAGYGASSDHTSGSGNLAWLDDSTPYENPSNLDTPELDVTGLTTPQLSFYYWIGDVTTGSYLCVDIFNGTTWTDSVGYYTPNNQWDVATINLSSYSSTTTKVRFRAMENLAGYDCDLCIDDVSVQEAPSCPAPSALTVTNVTTTSADLGWTENGIATLWDIELGAGGFTPTGTPTQAGVTTNPYTYIGLSGGTGYDWYVRADCGTRETSTWSGPNYFSTLVANDSCAVAEVIGEVTDQPWDTSTATTSGFDTHAINQDIWYVYTASANGLLDVDLCGSSFDTKLAVYEECDVLTELGYNDDSSYCDARAVQSALLDIPVVNGEDYMIQVGGFSTNSGPGDITIVLDSCVPADSTVTENILQTTADLVWYNHGEPTTWEVIIDTAGFAFDVNATPTYSGVNSPYGVTSLIAETDYEWYVMPTCGDTLDWVGPVAFTTLADCPFPSALTTTMIGPDQADLGWTENGIPPATLWDIEIDTLGFTPTGTPTYSGVTTNPYTVTGLLNDQSYQWYVRADCGTDAVSSWVGPASFTTLVECPAPTSPITTNIAQTTADLDWTDGWAETEWIVEWDTTGFIQGTGTMVTPAPTSHPVGLTLLTPNTSYDWYVRALCVPGLPPVISDWVGPITFTTLCDPITTYPYTENFDALSTVPDCWIVDPVVSSDSWEVFSANPGHGAPSDHTTGTGNFMGVDDSTPETVPAHLYTIPFDMTSLTVPQLVFYYWIGDNVSYIGSELHIDIDDGTTVTTDVGIYTETFDHWALATIDLTAWAGQTIVIDFRAMESASFYGDICLDDVTIQETPSCPPPTALTTSAITDSSAVISWTAGGTEPNWNVEWGLAGFVQGTGTMILNTTNPDTLTGLTAAMLYDWYVQADCDGTRDESDWVGPITFGTTGAGTCDHYVVLTDDYGDGWNGGVLDVYRNGNLALDNLTIITGAGPDTTGVTANQGDSLFFDYTGSGWPEENAYIVYRVFDNAMVISQGAGGAVPGDASIDNCCPPPTLAIAPSPFDFGNIPYNKIPTQVFTLTNIGDGTVTVTSAGDITLTGDPEFSIVSIYAPGGYPVSLPSDTLTVEVQFAPGAAASYSTVLSVVWGTVRSVTDVTISGTGCTPLPNDDCVNATAISGPYPAIGSGSNECAWIDCPGLLDWNTIWYEIDLPYGCQDVEITICAVDTAPTSVGIVMMDDCACDDYILREDGLGAGWITCPSTFQGYNMIFPNLTGPTTWLWPAQLVGAAGGIAFDYEIDVTPCETPNAPEDVNVAVVGTNVTVSWTYYSELTYTVYSDTDPYGTFTTVEGTGIAADHLDITPIPGVPTFYRVTCDNPPVDTRTYSDGVGIIERAPKVDAPTRSNSSNQNRERK